MAPLSISLIPPQESRPVESITRKPYYNVSHAPYACPTTGIYSGWQGRQLNTALDYSSGAQELLVCLVQVPSSSTSTGTLAVTTGGNDTWVAGQLAVTPN